MNKEIKNTEQELENTKQKEIKRYMLVLTEEYVQKMKLHKILIL